MGKQAQLNGWIGPALCLGICLLPAVAQAGLGSGGLPGVDAMAQKVSGTMTGSFAFLVVVAGGSLSVWAALTGGGTNALVKGMTFTACGAGFMGMLPTLAGGGFGVGALL